MVLLAALIIDRVMADPCMSSHGELRMSPSTVCGCRSAHNEAMRPPVECPMRVTES